MAPDTHNDTHDAGASLRGYLSGLRADLGRYMVSSFVPALAALATVSIFTRVFDADDYGRYSLMIAGAALLGLALSGWVAQSVLRFLPAVAEDGRAEFARRLSAFIAALSVAVVVLAAAGYPFIVRFAPSYESLWWPTAWLVVSETWFITYNSPFQATLRATEFSVYRVSWAILRLAVSLAYVFFIDRSVSGLIIGSAVANTVLVLPMSWRLGVWGRGGRWSLDRAFIAKLAAYGLPMLGWLMCGQLLTLSDRFIIEVFRGSGEVGIYSANYKIVSMGFGLVVSPILFACSPVIMNAWEKGDRSQVPALISTISRYYILLVLPVILVVSVFGKELMAIVLGPEFREGYRIIPYVLAGLAVWWLTNIGHKGLEILHRTRLMFSLAMVSTIVNIGLNLLWVPRFGYFAAAVTTLISYAIYPVLVYIVSRSLFPWHVPWASLAKVLLAGAAMLAVLWYGHDVVAGFSLQLLWLGIVAALAFLVYVAALMLLKELPRNPFVAWKAR